MYIDRIRPADKSKLNVRMKLTCSWPDARYIVHCPYAVWPLCDDNHLHRRVFAPESESKPACSMLGVCGAYVGNILGLCVSVLDLWAMLELCCAHVGPKLRPCWPCTVLVLRHVGSCRLSFHVGLFLTHMLGLC